MKNPIGNLLRVGSRKKNESLNILCAETHERYETGLTKTLNNFYAFGIEGLKHWNKYQTKVPNNYHILNRAKKENQLQHHVDFDLVLSQSIQQFQILNQIAKVQHLPIIYLEHTLPFHEWTPEFVKQIRDLTSNADIKLFISEYSREKWGYNENTAEVVHHGVDTELFSSNDSVERKPHLLSVVNDWKNRDWCMPAGQKIFTSLGYVPIEKISIGDKVLTKNGLFHYVVETFEREYFGNMVKIWIGNRKEPLLFTAEHNVEVKRKGLKKFIAADRLNVGEELLFPKIQQTDWSCNDVDLAWLIGLIIADGSITDKGAINITLSLDQELIAERAKSILQNIVGYSNIASSNRKTTANILTVEATSKIFGNWIKSRINKGSEKCIPDFLFNASDDVKIAVLQGMWIGDGSFKNGINHGNRAVYSSTSVKLASQVCALLHNFGINCSIAFHNRKTNFSNGRNKPIYRVVSHGKNNVNKCKELIDKGLIDSPFSYTIRKIEHEYEWKGKVYNCKVAENPTYVVYPGIITHNCCGYTKWANISKGLAVRVVGDTEGLSKPANGVEELVNEYQSSEIFLNTSIISPVPTSLLEAMACGCAIVTTATCMLPEIIKNGENGFISNDEKKLREYCQLLLNDRELCRKMGMAARQTILDSFSLDKFVNRWIEIFNKTANIPFLG